MSALGGIITREISGMGEDLIAMSRSMILRGNARRGAYLHDGIGLLHNERSAGRDTALSPRQPLTVVRDGKNYTVLLDGFLLGMQSFLGICDLSAQSAAELILEAYLAYGTDFVGSLQGSFSLAVCDESRHELLLARDRQGNRPLFYASQGERFLFASEIKAILHAMGETACVDTTRLRTHLIAPFGALSGADLYRDIHSIPAGHGGIYSPLGLTLFAYEEISMGEVNSEENAVLPSDFVCPDKETLRQEMVEILFAFDYPQFDHLMPGFLRALERGASLGERTEICVEDATLCMDIGYSRERADRLGNARRLSVSGKVPNEIIAKERELKRMDRLLQELLEEEDTVGLSYLFGRDWRSLMQEKNTVRRIRIRGMLYQILLWERNYSLRFV